MKKCFLYCRKSSEETNKQVQSIESQKLVMSQIATSHGLTIVDTIIDEKSAMKPHQRTGFTQMLGRITNKEASIILTWKTDRLSRNPLESGTICQMLQDGIIKEIVTVEKSYTPQESQILFALENAMASEYSRNLSMNVKRGQQQKLEKGVYPAAAPIGYLNAGDYKGNKTIEIDPATFPVLKKLWDILKTEKIQLSELYRIMQAKYPLYFRGRPQVIATSSFYRIFNNPFYCGLFKWQGEFHLGTHKPMLTQSEFEAIQEHLKKKEKNRKRTLEFDFKELFHCGYCQSKITAERKNKFIKATQKHKPFEYYRCPHHKVGIECKEKSMSKTEIEDQILQELSSIYLPPEIIALGKQFVKNKLKTERSTQSTIDKNMSGSMAKLKQAIGQIEDNICTETDQSIRTLMKSKLEATKIKLRKVEEDRETERAAPKEKLVHLRNQLDIINGVTQKFKKGKKPDRQQAVRALGSDWVIKGKKLDYKPHFLPSAIKTVKKSLPPELGTFEPPERGCTTKKLTSEEISFVWRDVWVYYPLPCFQDFS